ncbi:MAG: FAD:protein FMN transferase [Nanoarchaeota archaeon]|nr:FAD:protein FMN transferase [Nanoarchaeota archaeon]
MKLVSEEKELLGTKIIITLPDSFSFRQRRAGTESVPSIFSSCFAELKRIEKAYSRFLDSSELSTLNRNLSSWQSVSKEFFFLIKQALKYKKNSQGYFDVTLKATLDQLGYDKEYSFKKKEQQAAKKRFFDRFRKDILLDEKEQKVFLRKEIEIGGFGKGFAVDKVRELLEKEGIDHFLINAGGDMYAKTRKGELPWKIHLEHPEDTEKVIGFVLLHTGAIASSSPSRRKWKDGHHLINAKTKKPVDSVKQIFVLADSCMDADAYATALFTAGFDYAIPLSRKLPVQVYLLSEDNEPYMSRGFHAEFFE